MKSILITILVILVTIQSSSSSPRRLDNRIPRITQSSHEDDYSKQTFSAWEVQLKFFLLSDQTYKNYRTINRTCLDLELNMTENGGKLMTVDQFLIMMYAGMQKCQENETYDKTIRKVVQELMEELEEDKINEYFDCLLQKLHEMEPDSPLIRNFDPNKMTHSDEECREKIYERFDEPHANQTTVECSVLTFEELKEYQITVLVLAKEEDDEIRKKEMDKLVTYKEKKIDASLECVLEKL